MEFDTERERERETHNENERRIERERSQVRSDQVVNKEKREGKRVGGD